MSHTPPPHDQTDPLEVLEHDFDGFFEFLTAGQPEKPVCPPSAHQGPGDSLAAPAEAGQGVCTSVLSQTALFRCPRGRWDAVCSGPLRNATFSRVFLTAQARRA